MQNEDPNIDFEDYKNLTALAYAAVFDQQNWQAFLDKLTDVSGGVRTHMFGFDIQAQISMGLTASGYAPEFIETYNQHYGNINSWATGFVKHDAGFVIDCNAMCAPEQFSRTEFYNDWIRPQEDIGTGGGAILFKDESRTFMLGGNIRLKDADRVKQPWLRTVGLLIPHLQQAFQISRMISGQQVELDLYKEGALETGSAILFVSENGLVLFANTEAENLLASGTLLKTDGCHRLGFSGEAANETYKRYLAALRNEDDFTAGNISIIESGKGLARTCRAVRLDPQHCRKMPFPVVFGAAKPCLLLVVPPESRETASSRSTFAALHGLTATEVDVAYAIADGFKLSELAEQRSVSIHTVRNQLKSALSKTGARRQTELVAMIVRSRQPDQRRRFR